MIWRALVGDSMIEHMDFVTCIYAAGERDHPRILQCEHNESIHVWSTTIAVVEKTENCNKNEVLPALTRITDSCKFYDPVSFMRYVATKVVLLPSTYVVGNNFSRVCLSVHLSACLSVHLSVCVSVQVITFELLKIGTSFLVHTYIFIISRSSLSTKVTGSR